MRLFVLTVCLFLCWVGVSSQAATARRVRVRPVQLDYYAEQEDDEGPVLVSRQDNYGRATGEARQTRLKQEVGPRAPPVQTIRNYNKLNDDGSFTFGYEAADGSFKEETRGTDCVVRGKYGYIDPDGNKREFTYVSGNPCDPNAVEPEEEQLPDSGEENIPANIPIRRPILRPAPAAPRPKPARPTTLFEQDYASARPASSEEDEEVHNIPIRPVTLRPAPLRPVTTLSTVSQSLADLEKELRPRIQPTLRPQPSLRPQSPSPRPQPVSITPRPLSTLPATTYRPTTPQPSSAPIYLKPNRPTTPAVSAPFEQELKSFQLENNLVTTPRPRPGTGGNHPVYTTELVFDPSTGQYNTVVYQTLPQTNSDLSLRQSLRPFVPSPQFVPRQPYSQQQASPAQRQPTYQQQIFQNQQSNLLAQSQQLYRAQQERKAQHQQTNKVLNEVPASLLQQEPHRFTPSPKPYQPQHQPFYYLSASPERPGYANGQIDAFLRGHSL